MLTTVKLWRTVCGEGDERMGEMQNEYISRAQRIDKWWWKMLWTVNSLSYDLCVCAMSNPENRQPAGIHQCWTQVCTNIRCQWANSLLMLELSTVCSLNPTQTHTQHSANSMKKARNLIKVPFHLFFQIARWWFHQTFCIDDKVECTWKEWLSDGKKIVQVELRLWRVITFASSSLRKSLSLSTGNFWNTWNVMEISAIIVFKCLSASVRRILYFIENKELHLMRMSKEKTSEVFSSEIGKEWREWSFFRLVMKLSTKGRPALIQSRQSTTAELSHQNDYLFNDVILSVKLHTTSVFPQEQAKTFLVNEIPSLAILHFRITCMVGRSIARKVGREQASLRKWNFFSLLVMFAISCIIRTWLSSFAVTACSTRATRHVLECRLISVNVFNVRNGSFHASVSRETYLSSSSDRSHMIASRHLRALSCVYERDPPPLSSCYSRANSPFAPRRL